MKQRHEKNPILYFRVCLRTHKQTAGKCYQAIHNAMSHYSCIRSSGIDLIKFFIVFAPQYDVYYVESIRNYEITLHLEELLQANFGIIHFSFDANSNEHKYYGEIIRSPTFLIVPPDPYRRNHTKSPTEQKIEP